MGFEPHSVAGSALKLASRLPLKGPAPSCAPHERVHPFRNPLSWVQIQSGLTPNASRITLERAMGFEPTTTSLGSGLDKYATRYTATPYATRSQQFHMVPITARYRRQQ